MLVLVFSSGHCRDTWLETNDTMPADIRERHLQNHLPDSCDWFVQHKETQLWLKDVMKTPLLWLCGKPGAGMFMYHCGLLPAYPSHGKSVICSALVQHAEDNSVHVFYYFCSSLRSNADGLICRPSRLLRSIISQVIQKHQNLAIYVHDVYFLAHPVPTKKALMNLLPELLRGMGSVRLIIDGIDEWASRDQKDVLHDLSQIVSVDQSSHTCKILVASRATIEISRSLRRKNKPVTSISLSNGDECFAISRSIANFVESKLSDLPDHFDELDPDASIMACVKKTLIEKSHGDLCPNCPLTSCVLKLAQVCFCGSASDLEELYEKLLLVFVATQVLIVMEVYLVSWAWCVPHEGLCTSQSYYRHCPSCHITLALGCRIYLSLPFLITASHSSKNYWIQR